jgi:hypothetical protein
VPITTLRYHLPGVGPLTARLREESRELFAYLDGIGEVDRLRRLDHLGAVRLAYDGAHHSRWEYVATVLALIERTASLPRASLKSEVRWRSGRIASSAEELMKSWAILLNIGHLHWTFAVERILLQELWVNRRSRERFVSELPSEFRSFARSVFLRGDYYALYQLLVAWRMTRFDSERPSGLPWRPLLAAYVLPMRSESLERARRTFRRLRRVAYLGLDTAYAPAAVTLDLGRVLADEDTLERLAIGDRASDESELTGLDAHMSRTVYLARDVLSAMACREARIRGEIRAELKRGSPASILSKLAAGDLQHDLPKAELEAAVRLVFRADSPFDILLGKPLNMRREEEALAKTLRARGADGVPVVWSIPNRAEWIAQIHVAPGAIHDASCAISAVMDRLKTYRATAARELESLPEAVVDRITSPMAQDIVEAALSLVLRPVVRWEWGVGEGPAAIYTTRAGARARVAARAARLGLSPETRPRRAELELLYNMLLGWPEHDVAVALTNVRGYLANDRVPSLELDCVTVEAVDVGLRVRIGEAKTGAGSIHAARAQLRRTIAKLAVPSAVTVDGPREATRTLRTSQVPVRSRAILTLTV